MCTTGAPQTEVSLPEVNICRHQPACKLTSCQYCEENMVLCLSHQQRLFLFIPAASSSPDVINVSEVDSTPLGV